MRIWICVVTTIVIVPALNAQENLRPDVPVAIVGGKLLDGYEAPPIHHSVVVFENGVITQVGQKHNTEIPENAVVIDKDNILNPEGLRYKDEFVRHKILDCIGDLSLLGMPILGHVVTHKSGHTLNHALLKRFMDSKSCWQTAEVSAM